MIDPIDSLTFSLRANKGAYALLLGSGVSRAARIPTGWEVVEDLIRRLAKVRAEHCEPDPATWYERVYGQPPTYSGLLRELAPERLERQQLLRAYFEPNEDERQQGVKVPTRAHRAIAALVVNGHVKVILTTNFDRLMERALEEVGVVPIVVSSRDQLQGLPPLTQIPCLVVKMHGDYLDSRLRNTPEELERYDRPLNRLLDRILDEFGLIVCGWSAQWDPALRAALERCATHRYATYWTYRGQLDPEVTRLIARRRAQTIQIADADSFFDSLLARVTALEEYDRPHPLSVRMAVETLKNYLVAPQHRIRLSDLITRETEDAYEQLYSTDQFPLAGVPFDGQLAVERLHHYDAILERIQALMITGAMWGEQLQLGIWQRSMERIANPPRQNAGLIGWLDARRYPAVRLLYAFGLGAIAAGRFDNLLGVMEVPVRLEAADQRQPLFIAVDAVHVVDYRVLRQGMGANYRVPTSVYLFNGLREALREYFPFDDDYDHAFDRLEYLLALAYWDRDQNDWCPPGRFMFHTHRANLILSVHQEVESLGNSWPPLAAGFFGGSLERFRAAEQAVADFGERLRRQHW